MNDPTSRTLRLLSLLQTHKFWSGAELAQHLQISPRTLRRDVERLRELGYPVDATPGVAGGYRGGERVNISASLKGRIWSQAAAGSLKHWRDWCDSVGDKLLDDSITIDKVIGKFILPAELTGRPAGATSPGR